MKGMMEMVIDYGEKMYEAMLHGVFTGEYVDLLEMYVRPHLQMKYGEEDKKVDFMIKSYTEMGLVKTKQQKKRFKREVKELKTEGEILQFIKACFNELEIQLLRLLKRALDDNVDFTEASQYLCETVENNQKEILENLKGE